MMFGGARAPLAHDAAVPQRDLLLDAEWMREWFSARLMTVSAPPVACRVVRARYRPGDSLRVVFELTVADRTMLAVARTHAADTRVEVTSEPHDDAQLLPRSFHDISLGARFWTVPFDPRMPALPMLLAAPERIRGPLGTRWRRSRLAGYSPQKQAAIACLDRQYLPLAYAKAYGRAEDGAQAFALHGAAREAAARDRALSLPDTLAYDHDRRVLYLEAMPGRRIADLPACSLPHALSALGRAAAALHASEMPTGQLPKSQAVWEEQIDTAARLIARSRPDVSAGAIALARELQASRPDDDADVPLHGDLHLKNALIDRGRVSLIDLDQMSAGPAVADVAAVVASLIADGLTGRVPTHAVRASVESFADGYRSIRQYGPGLLAWHVGAALLVQRGARAITRIRHESLAQLSEIIAVARQVIRSKDVFA
jgi:aminoglycoside phosphotransferase